MFNPELVKLGSTGTSVLLLQEILIARGFKGKNGKSLTLSRKEMRIQSMRSKLIRSPEKEYWKWME